MPAQPLAAKTLRQQRQQLQAAVLAFEATNKTWQRFVSR